MSEPNESNSSSTPPKVWLRNLMIFTSVVLLGVLGWAFFDILNSYKKQLTETEKIKAQFQEASEKLKNEARRTDSLNRLFVQFNKYRHAVELQAYRDSVYRYLEFKPGEVAWKKIDSSVVTISDVYFGGGLYDYYFRYRVVDNSGKELEVKPEILFQIGRAHV